ncbi:MAG TPA: DUF309 domain-containing protein [Jatrophihabitans sp.]
MTSADDAAARRAQEMPQPGRRPRNSRPRDGLGRPLPYGSRGVERQPEGVARSAAEALAEAQRLLEAGLPFHAHEVLEDAWKAAPVAERELWRGLAQLAVGATHAARGNRAGALALIRRGAGAIASYASQPPHGLDIDAILQWSEEAQRLCRTENPVTLPAPPLIPEPRR